MRIDNTIEMLSDDQRVGALLITADEVIGSVDTIGLLKRAGNDHKLELRFVIPCGDNPRAAVIEALKRIHLHAPDLNALEIAAAGPFSSLREVDRLNDRASYARFVGVSAGPGWDGVDPYRIARDFFKDLSRRSGGAIEIPRIAVCRDVQAGGVAHSYIDRELIDPVYKEVLPTIYINLCHQSDASSPYRFGFKTDHWLDASSTLLPPDHRYEDFGNDVFEGACSIHRRTHEHDWLCFDGATSVRSIYKRRRNWQLECKHISEIESDCLSFRIVAGYCGELMLVAWERFGPVRFVFGGQVITGSGKDHSEHMLALIQEAFETRLFETVFDPRTAPNIASVVSLRTHDYPVSLGATLRASKLTLNN